MVIVNSVFTHSSARNLTYTMYDGIQEEQINSKETKSYHKTLYNYYINPVASFQPNIGGLTFHTHHTQLLL